MNRFGLPAKWTAIDLLHNLLVVAFAAACIYIFVKVVLYAFKRGMGGKEL